MSIGSVIALNRKKMGLTQDALAQQLGVTNQAVSKWESDQSCPDILLLPRIADIFGITVDELFGREVPKAESLVPPAEPVYLPSEPVYLPAEPELPWENDGALRVVIYKGHTYLASCPEQERITFEYSGPALNIHCAVNLSCEDVGGDVRAEGNVNCDAVSGNVQAGGNVACDDVAGHVNASGSVNCDAVEGNVSAGGNVTCDDIEGSVYAGGNVICDEIGGSATAGGGVNCSSDDSGSFHFSMGSHGGKNRNAHTSDENAEEPDDTIERSIDKFVKDIVRKCTEFLP